MLDVYGDSYTEYVGSFSSHNNCFWLHIWLGTRNIFEWRLAFGICIVISLLGASICYAIDGPAVLPRLHDNAKIERHFFKNVKLICCVPLVMFTHIMLNIVWCLVFVQIEFYFLFCDEEFGWDEGYTAMIMT
eukprot:UN15506